MQKSPILEKPSALGWQPARSLRSAAIGRLTIGRSLPSRPTGSPPAWRTTYAQMGSASDSFTLYNCDIAVHRKLRESLRLAYILRDIAAYRFSFSAQSQSSISAFGSVRRDRCATTTRRDAAPAMVQPPALTGQIPCP